jgi:hypothetical protein
MDANKCKMPGKSKHVVPTVVDVVEVINLLRKMNSYEKQDEYKFHLLNKHHCCTFGNKVLENVIFLCFMCFKSFLVFNYYSSTAHYNSIFCG